MTTTTSIPPPAGQEPLHGREPALARLLTADGHSLPPAGGVGEETWSEHVRHWIALFGTGPGTTVWEAGCGAGSFLYPFYRRGCTVGGTDLSGGLIGEARAAMPAGVFAVTGPAAVPVIPAADLLVASASSAYLDTAERAGAVLRQMAARARRAVLVTGILDPTARAARVHRYWTRDWFAGALRAAGLPRVAVASHFLPGYGTDPLRFSAWGWCE